MCKCKDDDCVCYQDGVDDTRDQSYNDGWNDGREEGLATAERPPTCLSCGKLLQKELFMAVDTIKCESCRREYKLVEVKE